LQIIINTEKGYFEILYWNNNIDEYKYFETIEPIKINFVPNKGLTESFCENYMESFNDLIKNEIKNIIQCNNDFFLNFEWCDNLYINGFSINPENQKVTSISLRTDFILNKH